MRIVSLVLTVVCLAGPMAWAEGGVPEKNELERYNHRGIWDGNFTEAKSGLGSSMPDSGSSEGKSGVKEDPRDYFITPFDQENRLYDEVERDEISNVAKVRDYAPDALLQFRHSMTINGQRVEKGYYQAHLGDWYSGSRKMNMGYSNQPIPEDLAKQRKKGKLDSYSAIILKKQGRVVAAFPINAREPYKREKGEKKSKKPFAMVAYEPAGPVLKVYYRNWIYRVDVQPSALPVTYPPVSQGAGIQLPPLQP